MINLRRGYQFGGLFFILPSSNRVSLRIQNWHDLKFLYSLYLKLGGWEILGEFPHHIKKKVIIAGPHTSNMDFFLGVSLRGVMNFDSHFIGKASLFKPPLGWIMKAWGGVPVDRSKSNNFVDAAAQLFDEREAFSVCFAPEGTRSKVEKFKTGFYYIAKKANVPILPVVFDYKNKKVIWKELFYPTDNAKEDIEKIENIFRGVEGRVKENSFG